MSATTFAPQSVPPPGMDTTNPEAAVSSPPPAASAAAASKDKAKAKSQPSGDGRNRVIDGYRGMCAIGVVLGHTVLINQLIFNRAAHDAIWTLFDVLPMFFALSGLMTYRVWVLGALNGKVRKRVPTITARLWRLLPVYYAIVLVVFAMRFAGSSADWSDLALHVSFMQVWSPRFVFWLDGPAWFLSDDMHFFILAVVVGPALCRVALRFPLSRWGVTARMLVMASLPVAMIAGGCGWIWLQIFHDHNTSSYVRYTPLFTMPEFAFGMLLAVIAFTPGVTRVRAKLSLALTAVGLAGLALLAYFGWRVAWMNINDFGYPLISIFCCVLLLGALMAPPLGVMSRVMGNRPFQVLAGLGLTILLVQEPLMILLEKWGFVVSWDPTSNWISGGLLLCVAAGVAMLATRGIEQPALKLQDYLKRLKSLEVGRDRRHRGPIPRMLPDVSVALPSGEQIQVRSALSDRPLLLAFGDAGAGALAEQQFRLLSGESTALHISPSFERSATASQQLGAQIAFDPDGGLSRALNIPVALVEVSPEGLITAFQRSRREALGAWA